jgi:hypothetical protein
MSCVLYTANGTFDIAAIVSAFVATDVVTSSNGVATTANDVATTTTAYVAAIAHVVTVVDVIVAGSLANM